VQRLRVSIGICAHNEENNIGSLLRNLTKQPLPYSSGLEEIIVVSSGSTDRTDQIVGQMAKEDERIKIIREKERTGKSQALNILFGRTSCEVLVVVSADTKPLQGSLKRLIESMKPSIGGACAETLPMNRKSTIMEFCNLFLWKVHNRVLNEESEKGTLSHLGGDMWAIKRGIVHRIPEDVINDDAYLGIALKKRGWQVKFVPDAKVFIGGPATPLEFIHQRERIVIGHKQVEEIFGFGSTTIGAFALKKPLFSLKVVVNEVRKNGISDYPKIFVGLFLELVAQTLGRVNSRRKSKFLKWKQIRSTKDI